jgi:predicted aspartyl protease
VSYKFDSRRQLIIARARLVGPKGEIMVQMALDTGASSSLVGWRALQLVGYAPGDAVGHVDMTTGSGVESAPKIKVRRIEALGKRRVGLAIIGHTLPPSASVDGLLGLDFFRRRRLTIDFRKSTLSVD